MSDSKTNHFGLLRAAPEPRLEAIPPEEAVDVAKKAFYDARLAQFELLALGFNGLLFDPRTVTYSRLKMLRGAARDQVKVAQRVSQLVDDAIAAFESTAPVERSDD